MRKDDIMLEIKGKINTAICYAKVIEEEAVEQIRRMCNYKLAEGSQIRIMPDVHAGKGCTIGTTMTVVDKVCPNIVVGVLFNMINNEDYTVEWILISSENVYDEQFERILEEENPWSNIKQLQIY